MATRKPAPRKSPTPRTTTKGLPPFTGNAQAHPSAEELWKQIAEAAYYKAKAGDSAPGGGGQDWIGARAKVMPRPARPPWRAAPEGLGRAPELVCPEVAPPAGCSLVAATSRVPKTSISPRRSGCRQLT